MRLKEREKLSRDLQMVWDLSKYADKWVSVIEYFENLYKRKWQNPAINLTRCENTEER